MKVLVTGATGFVGSHVIEGLLRAGHQVRGLSRKEPMGERRKPGAEYISGVDVTVSTTMTREMFDDVQSVIHLVGIIQEMGAEQTFQRVHVYGTQNVVDAAQNSGVPGRFVYMSALGSGQDAPAEYSRTKYAAEQIVKRCEMPYTIFRPSLILGRDGEFVSQMGDLIKHGGLSINVPFPFIPVPGPGLNKFQPIYIDDLVSCIVRCLELPQTAGKTYEVGGATQLTFNELINGLARAQNVSKSLFHAPIPMMRVVAGVMEALMPKPPVTRDQLANLGRDNITDSHVVTDVFGVKPLSFDEMLPKLYAPHLTETTATV